jgi:Family of unknown function (DUF6788)
MTQPLSSLRSQLTQAQQQLPALLEDCFAREPLLPGSLYTLRRKCGKPNCRCNRGELHKSTVLSYRGLSLGGTGRPQNISPAPEQIDTLRNMTNDYRRVRQARAKLVRWQRQLLALVDALEAARIRLGEAEFQKGRASAIQKPRSSQR